MRRNTGLLLTALFAVALAACSDDDDKGDLDAAPDLTGPDSAIDGPSIDEKTPPLELGQLDGPPPAPDTAEPDLEQPDLMPPDQSCGKLACNCTYEGKQLWGKVKVVTALADFKVQVVTALPDLKVQKVTTFPNSCGKWQFITTGIADFTIQEVSALPDFKIQYVTVFPGLP